MCSLMEASYLKSLKGESSFIVPFHKHLNRSVILSYYKKRIKPNIAYCCYIWVEEAKPTLSCLDRGIRKLSKTCGITPLWLQVFQVAPFMLLNRDTLCFFLFFFLSFQYRVVAAPTRDSSLACGYFYTGWLNSFAHTHTHTHTQSINKEISFFFLSFCAQVIYFLLITY